jgi:hypothetical protein
MLHRKIQNINKFKRQNLNIHIYTETHLSRDDEAPGDTHISMDLLIFQHTLYIC